MADFEKALKKIIGYEGGQSHYQSPEGDDHILLCSNCFKDEGLRIDAYKIGIINEHPCPNCKSIQGHKLNKTLVHHLCYRFFVRGTIHKTDYGGSPIIQFNNQHFNQTDIDFSSWLRDDVKLIEKFGEIGLFYYGPRLWMVGEIEPLKDLQDRDTREKVVDRIFELYPTKQLTKRNYFYRLRKNPDAPHEFLEYDTAPKEFLGGFRFDKKDFPVWYGSPDLELCIHECRTTVEDSLYVAKLVPARTLKMLDLSFLIDEDVTEFESLDLTIHFLFLAGSHSYDICRDLAIRAYGKGFDGIIYPSYFSYVRTGSIPFDTVHGMSIRKLPPLKEYAQSQSIPNIALFGRPIKEGKIKIECINKVVINRVSYDLTFGPCKL